jgi:hypothetical protein
VIAEPVNKPAENEHVGSDTLSGEALREMGEQRITYGDWIIYYDPPPIPARNCDWHFTHRDYDASYEGEEDGWVSNGLAGSGYSVEDCKAQIAEIEEDRGMPLTAEAAA